jgi:UV DNA damage endonuclease
MSLRLGLCCIFREQEIKFRTTTAAATSRMPRSDALAKLSSLCLINADALAAALEYCHEHSIGCFRINSQILPLRTHPQQGYRMDELPDCEEIERRFQACGDFARQHDLRTCFHPDQFVVLNSQRPEVVDASIQELEYQAEVAQWVRADVINVHGGGAFGNNYRVCTGEDVHYGDGAFSATKGRRSGEFLESHRIQVNRAGSVRIVFGVRLVPALVVCPSWR